MGAKMVSKSDRLIAPPEIPLPTPMLLTKTTPNATYFHFPPTDVTSRTYVISYVVSVKLLIFKNNNSITTNNYHGL